MFRRLGRNLTVCAMALLLGLTGLGTVFAEDAAPPAAPATVSDDTSTAPSVAEADDTLTTAPVAVQDDASTTAPVAVQDDASTTVLAAVQDDASTTVLAAVQDDASTTAPAAVQDDASTTVLAAVQDDASTTVLVAVQDDASTTAPVAVQDDASTTAPAAAQDDAPTGSPAAAPGDTPTAAPSAPPLTPPAPQPDVYTIVALGDSISAGYEPGLTVGSIPYGYVERLYEQALFRGRAEAVNYGIIGLRVEGLNRLLQGAASNEKIDAEQLQDFSMFPRADEITAFAQTVADRASNMPAALARADLVTVVIGGNDFRPFLTDLIDQSPEDMAVTLEQQYPQLLEQYTSGYETALRQIAAMAPQAPIVITDQYLPISELILNFVLKKDPALYETLHEQVVKPLTDAVDGLAAKLREEGLPVTAVHVADRFKGAEGRMTHINNKDNHPTQDGYEAFAEAIAEAVWPEYRKPAPRPADVPISVIIRGRELVSDYKPTLVNDRTFLALRDVSDAMGAELAWNDSTKTAVFRQHGREVAITIDAPTMIVNGVSQPLDTPAYLRDVVVGGKTEGKTYVPLAVIADGLGYKVDYSKPLQTAFINE